LHGVF
jgi:hypothetical protein